MTVKNQASIFFVLLFSVFLVQHPAGAARDNFQELDSDKDGIISQNEWLDNARDEHESLDANRDSRVSYNEFHHTQGAPQNNHYDDSRSYGNKRRQPRFEDMDANHDGVLSRNEWPTNAGEYYVALDANGDDNVSYNEFFNRKQISATVLNGLDTNNDNRVSRGEWTGESAEFNRVDTNRDNFLTVAELSAASTAAAASTSTSQSTGSSIEEIFLKLFQKQ